MDPNPGVAHGYLVRHHRGNRVSVSLIMHSEYMQILRMVNIDVNVDSGNTQVCVVMSKFLNSCMV
jgi:hypothetical protein